MSLQRHLVNLEALDLIRLARLEPEVEYMFRHALVQEAAYFSLVKMDRRRLHHAVGETLEQVYSAGMEALQVAPQLARHFAEAGDEARALHYYAAAGRAAAAMYANAEAIDHFTRALALATRRPGERATATDLFLRRGRAYELNAQDGEALRNYEAMEAWAAAAGDEAARLAALAARATIYVKPSIEQNPDQGLSLSQQALVLARALGDRAAEAKVRWNLLQYHLVKGELEEAQQQGEQALAIARAEGLREQEAYVLTDLLKTYYQMEQPEQALEALRRARALWRELGSLNMLADNLATTSMLHTLRGDYDQALALSAEAAHLSQRIGNLWNQAYAHYLLDLAHFDRGELGRAIEVAKTSMRLAEQAGFSEGVTQAYFDLGLIYSYAGDHHRALDWARQARARVDKYPGAIESSPQMDGLIALLYAQAGQTAEAQAVLDASPVAGDPEALQRQFILTQALFAQVRAELALARGEPERALAEAGRISRNLRQSQMRLFLPDALLLQAQAHLAAGRVAQAHAALDAARAEAQSLGSRRSLWLILAALANVETARGNTTAADELRRQAREIIEYIAAHAGSAEMAAAIRQRVEKVIGD